MLFSFFRFLNNYNWQTLVIILSSILILDGEYQDAEIGSVNMLRAKVSFMGLEIGELFDKLDIGINIGKFVKAFNVTKCQTQTMLYI